MNRRRDRRNTEIETWFLIAVIVITVIAMAMMYKKGRNNDRVHGRELAVHTGRFYDR